MENASKALIIAGSIILAVLIVTLGMYFYSQSAGLGKTFSMTEYEIQQHNSTFQSYEGKITGAEAMELYDVVYQYNLAAGRDKLGVNFSIYKGYPNPTNTTANVGASCLEVMSKKTELSIGKFYEVKMFKDKDSGIISQIYVCE